MCGINGILNQYHATAVLTQDLQAMNAVIRHRGPDDTGIFLDKNIGFGFQRLSIMDVEHAHQPMSTDDKRMTIVFNGEIYNFKDLRNELKTRGYAFHTTGDTEVLLKTIHCFGFEDGIRRLNGMFAFAIWDAQTKELMLGRDRSGIKPLYYHFDGYKLVFSSEIKAILQVVPPMDINREALNEYLALRYVSSPDTMFRNVKKLPPAHMLVVKNGRLDLRRYWDTSYDQPKIALEKDCVRQLSYELGESVRRMLVSDVEVGAFLSGGLDSSIIVALMRKWRSDNIKTFSIGFQGEPKINELSFAKIVAEKYKTDHTEIICPNHVFCLIPKIMHQMDDPIAEPVSIPLYCLSQEASKQLKVVLTGEGADELFAGYGKFKRYMLVKNFGRWERLIPACLAKRNSRNTPRLGLLRHIYDHRRLSVEQMVLMEVGISSQQTRASLIAGASDAPVLEMVRQKLLRHSAQDFLEQALYFDFTSRMPEYILLKNDKMSMGNSLELRVPFLDNQVIDLASRIPSQFKLKNYTEKSILRRAFADVLPEQIKKRGKFGFSTPLSIWIKNEWPLYKEEYLSSSLIRRQGLFEEAGVQRLISEFESGSNQNLALLWAMVLFQAWWKSFKDSLK